MGRKGNLYTEERWEKVDKENKELFKSYMRYLRTNKKRPKTAEQYYYDVRMFLVWDYLNNENMKVLEFKKAHFDDFKFFMIEERNASNARVDRLLSCIRMMMDYAEDDDSRYKDYDRNAAKKVKSLGVDPVKEITFLTENQIILLRNHLKEKKLYKLMFLLDVFYDSGGRISEVLQIKNVKSLLNGYSNKVVLKGGGKGYLLLHDRAKESLALYLKQLGDDEYIWVKQDGTVVTKETTLRGWVYKLNKILNELQDKPIHFTPHSFRHSMIENAGNGTHYLCKKIKRKFTIEEIALLAHHKNTDMTKSYMKPKDNEIILGLFGINLD